MISAARSSNSLCHFSRQCPASLHRDTRQTRGISPFPADDRQSGRPSHPQVPRHGHARLVNVKEIYTSSHMWSLFERSFLVDMARYASATHDKTRRHRPGKLRYYKCRQRRHYFLPQSLLRSEYGRPDSTARFCPITINRLPALSVRLAQCISTPQCRKLHPHLVGYGS